MLSLHSRVTLSCSTLMQQPPSTPPNPRLGASRKAQSDGWVSPGFLPESRISSRHSREPDLNSLISFSRRRNFNKQVTFGQTFATGALNRIRGALHSPCALQLVPSGGLIRLQMVLLLCFVEASRCSRFSVSSHAGTNTEHVKIYTTK